jgi:hypothetical protein
MASPKPSVLKRQRERKRAEKAALKREQRAQRSHKGGDADAGGVPVATSDDLEGYGVAPPPGASDERRTR